MSTYSDRYRQRVSRGTDGSARSLRMKQAKDTYNRNFKDIMGYLQAEYLDADMVNNNELAKPLDIVISTNTNGYERVISCRPDTLLKTVVPLNWTLISSKIYKRRFQGIDVLVGKPLLLLFVINE